MSIATTSSTNGRRVGSECQQLLSKLLIAILECLSASLGGNNVVVVFFFSHFCPIFLLIIGVVLSVGLLVRVTVRALVISTTNVTLILGVIDSSTSSESSPPFVTCTVIG